MEIGDDVTPGGLFIPEYRVLEDEERSICPLIPSPTLEFSHPLAHLPTIEYDKGGQTPSSVGTEISTVPPEIPLEIDQKDGVLREDKRSSSSSSSSCVLPEAASAQLLHSHRYMTLATDANCQENGGIKTSLGALTLNKTTLEYSFMSWNWPLIRRWCFWCVMSITVACVCVIIGYIGTIPRRCNPTTEWYQGALIYQVFPASFQDSNDDGLGDLRGLSARVPYIKKLGAKAIRLSYLFPALHYPEHYNRLLNMTAVEPSLGTFEDFEELVENLHMFNISLILDLPLYPYFEELRVRDPFKDIEITHGMKHVIVNNHILVSPANKTHNLGEGRGVVTDIIKFWSDYGVDGFFLEGLEELAEDERLASQLMEWREELQQGQILICSMSVLTRMDPEVLPTAMKTLDLIEIRFEPGPPESLAPAVSAVMESILYSKPGYPWPYWTLAGIDSLRLASRTPLPNMTLAATVLSMALPGSNGIFYGDEIGLQNLHDPHGEREDVTHVQGLVPMVWGSGTRGFTRAGVIPWLPTSVASLQASVAAVVLHQMSIIREASPSLYMHSVWANGKVHPNTNVRDMGSGLVSVERSYPRRHSFLLVANIGPKAVTKDLSGHHYGGRVLIDERGLKDEYTTFRQLTLNPGQFILVKLDK